MFNNTIEFVWLGRIAVIINVLKGHNTAFLIVHMKKVALFLTGFLKKGNI